ncbi:tautomerase family protein [Rhodococcus sp. UNC23MFCrub1.1]|uniref:tautomerase family protein n=1 Tax=Rhodococcus sp. UNC23MFCrub1.1 TaxID=1449068 RepID=UPI00047FA621|nr:tautomerase family protein [Rhodococcus sp. UNC23MFCrub1.1]
MPLWNIRTAKNVYTADDKKAFADSITSFYLDAVGLPKFYTSVVFHEFDPENFFLGGEPTDDFVLIEVVHVARNMDELSEKLGATMTEDDLYSLMRESFAGIVRPFVDDRGLRWETAVVEGLFKSWMIDGMTPPPPFSDAEKTWARQNKPSPYDTESA